MIHSTRPIQVWIDCDVGIADTVEYLQTVPGVRTHASCEGSNDGAAPYPPQVMVTWTPQAFERLRREFDVEVLGDGWGYLHPLVGRKEQEP